MFEYGDDVLSGPDPHRREIPEVEATPGLLVEVRSDGWAGRIKRFGKGAVVLVNRRGQERMFKLHPAGFLLDGEPVTLVPPRRDAPTTATRVTASGSLAVDSPARVARASRIWVEGIHDAELLEIVWGDDLRVEGIVVEVLDGIDDLEEAVRAFCPGPDRRLGVLVDHLVPGSKEQRIIDRVDDENVLVTGHPFVDVWAAVKPKVLGIAAWPEIPKGQDWKRGVCDALGVAEPPDLWRRIRTSVTRYTDLDRSLVGAVERLIDFLTDPTG